MHFVSELRRLVSGGILFISCAIPVGAQVYYVTPGQYMRGQVAGAIGSFALAIGDWKKHNDALESEVQAARQRFWEAANEADREQAARVFEEKLFRKDVHFVADSMSRWLSANNPLFRIAQGFSGSRNLDGGISPFCRGTFDAWAEAMTTELGDHQNLARAVEATWTKYEAYRRERDMAEFLFFRPGTALRASRPDPREYLALWLLATKLVRLPAEAAAEVEKTAEIVGPVRLGEIVGVIQGWTIVGTSLEGVAAEQASTVIQALVHGNRPAITGDWRPFTREFSEIRGRLADPRVNETAALDSIRALWNNARDSSDWTALHRAVTERVALADRLREILVQTWQDAEIKLTLSMLETKLVFMDHGLRQIELAMVCEGRPNPRNTENVASPTVVAEQSRGAAPRRGMPAPSGAGQSPSAPPTGAAGGGVVAEPPAFGRNGSVSNAADEAPIERAIALAQTPDGVRIFGTYLDTGLQMVAREWDNAQWTAAQAREFHMDYTPEAVARRRHSALKKGIEHAYGMQRDWVREIAESRRILNGLPPHATVHRQPLEKKLELLASLLELITQQIALMEARLLPELRQFDPDQATRIEGTGRHPWRAFHHVRNEVGTLDSGPERSQLFRDVENLASRWDQYVREGRDSDLQELAAQTRTLAETVVRFHAGIRSSLSTDGNLRPPRVAALEQQLGRLAAVLDAVNQELPAIERECARVLGQEYTPRALPTIGIAGGTGGAASVISYAVNEWIEAEKNGRWLRAQIREIQRGQFRIVFERIRGDEWVSAERIRKATGSR